MEKKSQKIQTGLRIPIEQYDKLKTISDRVGISINDIALQGIELWLMDFEAHRVPFHNQQDIV
jgi:predicted DNA-binding protein